MSSLLQSPGRTNRKRGVELFMYTVEPDSTSIYRERDTETYTSSKGKTLPVLYRIWRKPAGMFGPWVVFRINGTEEVPDLSIPMRMTKLPRDAQRLTESECNAYWHS